MKKAVFIIISLIVLSFCVQRKVTNFEPLPFPEMTLPGMLTDTQDRADWMAEHYWDKMTDPERAYPSDSLLVSGVRKEDVEQRFSNWVSVLEMVATRTAEKTIRNLCDKVVACEEKNVESSLLETITDLMEKYLYDANSPFRNEDYYGAYAARLAEWDGLSEELRGKYENHAERTSLNKVGTVAADFRFSDKSGKIRTLHGIKSPMTLLFFSNPGCTACMNIIFTLRDDPHISQMIEDGRLAVVNVYIDEDIAEWRSYVPVYPEVWYNGFDPDLAVRTENLYDVRAIPSLYLLDADKRVIMKDAPEDKLFKYLSRQ